MLSKSLTSTADTIIYDLEDSVAPAQKTAARQNLVDFLATNTKANTFPEGKEIAVRVNPVGRNARFVDDITAALAAPAVTTLVIPKVHSSMDLSQLLKYMKGTSPDRHGIHVIASIESALGLRYIYQIGGWNDDNGRAKVTGLLFAAEDYCADTSIQRTRSRLELLYARSRLVNTAKSFKISAIDMVCVNYKDPEYLLDECQDGRRLGFDGKQAIHPDQIETIHSAFAPSPKEISRAVEILDQMSSAYQSRRGAYGLVNADGDTEMIDEPMVKQAKKVLERARRSGIKIPDMTLARK